MACFRTMRKGEMFFGFNTNEQQASNAIQKNLLAALECIETEINSCITTSTPNTTLKESSLELRHSMSFLFSKYFEESATSLQFTDNDSGFVSNTHESSESLNNQPSSIQVEHNSLYTISEDALLEKPASVKKVPRNENVYEEFSHLYYLNSIVPSSVQSPEDSQSEVSGEISGSDASIILPMQSPIVVLKDDLQCVKYKENKENVNPHYKGHDKIISTDKSCNNFSLATRTPNKSIINTKYLNASPELFSEGTEIATPTKLVDASIKPFEPTEMTIDTNLVKKINKALSGVLPPPNLTILQISAEEMLDKLRVNADLLDLSGCRHNSKSNESLLNTDLYATRNTPWPQILELRYHGLHYNCSNLNTEIETLSVKYGQRFIGAETQSSCTVFDAHASLSSPAKRRLASTRASLGGARWTVKSPGRRLSHLARRRITFSSSSLKRDGGVAVVPSGSGITQASSSRQILVDSKRFELLVRKKTISPRKKTPRKSPRKRIRTPSSSTKKIESKIRRLANANDTGSFSGGLKATKRALFQSPDKNDRVIRTVSLHKSSISSLSNVSLSPWKRRSTPKAALFASPDQHSNSSTSSVLSTASDSRVLLAAGPRRNIFASPMKTASSASQLRKVRLDSESNDSDVGSMRRSMDGVGGEAQGSVMMRVKSDGTLSSSGGASSLSIHHKKKLQWAVYEALRSQQIGLSHPNFKQYAATLARVTRRFLPNLNSNAPRPEGGTSERMLRIARQHVFAVTKGKTVEEILQLKGVGVL